MDRESLAWAAGFFDGEGSAFIRRHRPKASHRKWLYYVSLSLAQTEPKTLRRFHAAVHGLGQIRGPYAVATSGYKRKPIWNWSAGRFEHVQAIVAMLWPWLSEPKRAQITTCLQELRQLLL